MSEVIITCGHRFRTTSCFRLQKRKCLVTTMLCAVNKRDADRITDMDVRMHNAFFIIIQKKKITEINRRLGIISSRNKKKKKKSEVIFHIMSMMKSTTCCLFTSMHKIELPFLFKLQY